MFGLKKGKSSLFYKYLLSYLIIFMIPFATISIIFYQMSVKNLREEIIQSNIGNLEQVKDLSDSRMKELENIAMRISFDNRLTPYMLKQPYYAKEAIKELITYQVNSSIIDGLFLKYHDDERVYSPKGSGTIENSMNNIYRFKDSEKNNFRETLKAASKPIIQPIELDGDDQRIISYVYPIPPNSSVSYGSVVFFIKELTMKNFTQNILKDFSGNTYIFNDENELLVANNVGKPLDIEDIQDLALAKTGVENKRINNESYSFVTVHSEESNWTFVAAIPTVQFYSKMSSLKTTILIILSMVALLGLAITIYLSSRQYRPIRKLTQFINTNRDIISTTGIKTGELESIRETIEFIFEDSEKLRKKMHLQQPLVRDHFLLKLLKDNARIGSDVNDLLKDLKISFKGDHFFVIMVSLNEKISGEESIQNRERILRMLTEVSYKECMGYGIELIHDNAVVLIVSTTKEDAENSRKNFSKELIYQLGGLFQVTPTVGVGKIYIGMDLINRSFIEAAASIEHNLLNAENDLVFFEEITANKGNSLWYPIENQVQFIQSLKQGDQVVAKEALSNIIQNLKVKKVSYHMMRSMCFDVVNTVLKFISEFELLVNAEDMHKLVEFNSVDDLEEKVNIMIIDICHKIGKRKESNNNYLRNEILEYIHAQFKSHDLSLGNTAEEFQLSVSYLSRLIKDQTGSTFTQFVWKLRNREFKRQLKQTTHAIKDIVSDIGYVDVANFTRKFKQEEGLTPGQYRKRYIRDDGNENVL